MFSDTEVQSQQVSTGKFHHSSRIVQRGNVAELYLFYLKEGVLNFMELEELNASFYLLGTVK